MSTAPPAAPEDAKVKAKATPTTYTVLVKMSDSGWLEAGTFKTVGSEAAIKAFLARDKPKDVVGLVAVPARSWQPVKPKTETVTKTSLEPLT